MSQIIVHNQVPFIRILVPFVMGIVIGLWIEPNLYFYLCTLLAIGILLLLTLLSRHNRVINNICWGITYSVVLFTIGIYLYSREKKSLSTLQNEAMIVRGTIEDYPIEKANTYQFTVKMETGQTVSATENTNLKQLNGSMLIYQRKADGYPMLIPGDMVTLRLTPRPLTNRGNPYEFDYKFYMENRRIKYMAFIAANDILQHETPPFRNVKQYALIVRERLLKAFSERGITDEQLPLLAAITLGYREYLDSEQEEYFSRAGIMHIMAVSGLHAGIVSMLVLYLLFFMRGRWYNVKICIAIITLWAFAFITGLTPSVVRASLMFSFLQVGKMIKRPVNGLNSVLASAFILLLIQPSVLFVSGFQLSYMAVIYIVCFYSQLNTIYTPQNSIGRFLWDSTSITLLAQAGTLPLTITSFNRFPVWFILSNVLILPIATASLVAGLLVLVFYPVVFLSEFIASITNYLIWLTEWLTVKAASLPFAVIDGVGMTTFECVVLVVVIALCIRYLLNMKELSPIPAFVSILIMVGVGNIISYRTANTEQLIVYNEYNDSTIGMQSGKNLIVWSTNPNTPQSVKKHAATLGLKLSQHALDNKPFLIEYKDHQVLITNLLNQNLVATNTPEIVILQGDNIYFESDLYFPESVKAIVVDNNVSLNYYQRQVLNKSMVDSIHYVSQQGAFIYY